MLSIKDYAKLKNVTYEAVRQSVKRYEKELEDHIFIQGKTRFLDDFAMDFLDQKRAVNPIVIYEVAKDEEIDRLNKEMKKLKDQIIDLQDKLLKEQQKVIPLEAKIETSETEKRLAIAEAVQEANKLAEKEKNDALEETSRKLKEQAEIEKSEAVAVAKKDTAAEKEKEFEPIRKELDEARQELERPIGFIEWFKTRGRKG